MCVCPRQSLKRSRRARPASVDGYASRAAKRRPTDGFVFAAWPGAKTCTRHHGGRLAHPSRRGHRSGAQACAISLLPRCDTSLDRPDSHRRALVTLSLTHCVPLCAWQPISAGGGSNKAQKAVVNKKAKGKKDDSDDEVRSLQSLWIHASHSLPASRYRTTRPSRTSRRPTRCAEPSLRPRGRGQNVLIARCPHAR